jgi:hypothetical protein
MLIEIGEDLVHHAWVSRLDPQRGLVVIAVTSSKYPEIEEQIQRAHDASSQLAVSTMDVEGFVAQIIAKPRNLTQFEKSLVNCVHHEFYGSPNAFWGRVLSGDSRADLLVKKRKGLV